MAAKAAAAAAVGSKSEAVTSPQQKPSNSAPPSTAATQRPIPDLPNDIASLVSSGAAVACQLNVLKATYSDHFGRNSVFPCDIIVTNIAHALHDDVVIVQLADSSTWTRRVPEPGSPAPKKKQPQQEPGAAPAAAAAAASSESTDDMEKESDEIINDDNDDDDDDDGVKTEAAVAADDGKLRHADGRLIVNVLKKGNRPGRTRAEPAELVQARICANGNLDAPREEMLGALLSAKWHADPLLQPRGKVVYVVQRPRPADRLQSCRLYVPEGQQAPQHIVDTRWYRFKSYNQCYPFIAIYGKDIERQYKQAGANGGPNEAVKFLFMVEFSDKLGAGRPEDADKAAWADGKFPVGRVVRSLGNAGTVDAESVAIAATNQIRDLPFDSDVLACIAETCPIPSAEELKRTGRRDLRDAEFVTSIDPATARDLDDALSITALPGGGYRVGVHIADVSHFVEKGSALDFEAQQRCTSTYLVERVIPMLPSKLCEDYCSLNAGVDKFAFSGLWDFDAKGNKQSEWFGQSLIRNRCRMTYQDAQSIIEGDESGDSLNFVNETAPRAQLVTTVVDSVKMLYKLSNILREERTKHGALALGKRKLSFIFEDFNSRLAPCGLKFEVQREANRLVEEFMLWANFRVAEKVVEFLPKVTLLRQHSPPVKKKLDKFLDQARKSGYKNFGKRGGKTGGKLREALESYKSDPNYDVLSFLVVICMSLAKYVVSSHGMDDKTYENSKTLPDGVRPELVAQAEEKLKRNANHKRDSTREERNEQAAEKAKATLAHFALAAPYYCHFTSPIRRYADLITHRQLLLALDIEAAYEEMKKNGQSEDDGVDLADMEHGHYMYEEDEIMEIARRCNTLKEKAKKAGGMSTNLFLSLFMDAARVKEEARIRAEQMQQQQGAGGTVASPLTRQIPVRFYATGIIVRLMPMTFTVHVRELALEVEIYHNSPAQLWTEENEVDEDNGCEFSILWPSGQREEHLSVFSEFVGEITTVTNPITQIYFVVQPPSERTGKKMISAGMKI